ncbi:alanine racemase [Zhihengliuella halotolerans]|uniref:Alanine racemase n=1 Tax=Zhihengliuella halotolerans TaxID=370736 RepID=A0A4Q8AEP5_9MICC|nr:alanine racemase [Zhihengliuella halotolerans]RZU62654.1 alanine racemase [Zhihengliuella halotolerans]
MTAALTPPTLQTLPDPIAANVVRARSRTRARLMAVVKADAYGHGAAPVARAAVAAGASWLGTTDVGDAVAIRAAGLRTPILTWLNPSGIDAEASAAHAIDVAVGSVDELETLLLQRAPAAVRVHLHVDAGMAREGCPEREWETLIARARAAHVDGRIEVRGLMGHLPSADRGDPAANAPAVERMRRARAAVVRAGFGPLLAHLAATSGTLTDPATHLDMVRVGAGLVGIDPSGRTALTGASRLTAPVVHSRAVAVGTAIGYDGSHVTTAETHLSVLPLGYADGIPREISRDAFVEIEGLTHRIVGRVSMDQIVVDTGPRRYARGTTATVFGPGGTTAPTIHDWARWSGSIAHTIVTGIGARVRRSIA